MCQMCDEYEAELRRMGIAMGEKITVELDSADPGAARVDRLERLRGASPQASDGLSLLREDRER